MADLRLSAVETDAVSAGVPLIEMSSDVAMEVWGRKCGASAMWGGRGKNAGDAEVARGAVRGLFVLLYCADVVRVLHGGCECAARRLCVYRAS
eukprot:366109-Chlamydomonas_euryale.AAC.4